jgi:DNA-binding FrmR family transcriptional regulator
MRGQSVEHLRRDVSGIQCGADGECCAEGSLCVRMSCMATLALGTAMIVVTISVMSVGGMPLITGVVMGLLVIVTGHENPLEIQHAFYRMLALLHNCGIPSHNPILLHRIIAVTTHASHPDIVKRLKRVEGHLRAVIEMIENKRPCADIAQQMQAIESAVTKAKKTLIHDHIDHCLEQVAGRSDRASRGSVEEFKGITKYL